MLVGPLTNDWQPRTKGLLYHIFRITDENGRITHVGKAGDVFNVISVTVGAQKGLALIFFDRQAPNEVSHEDERLSLQLWIFMIVIVHIPCLVSYDEVIMFGLHQV